MPDLSQYCFSGLYRDFSDAVSDLDCGQRCAPYNEGGIPFCCDTSHAVPSAYQAEWEYLKTNTDLWHLWEPDDTQEKERLLAELPAGQVLIECQGAPRCQRAFRSITCRAFPFFPYLDSGGKLLGLAYYREYRDRCWLISNLDVVTPAYLQQFIFTYDAIFTHFPEEVQNFASHSEETRRIYTASRQRIPLLHRDGACYSIRPADETLKLVSPEKFPKFGIFKISEFLAFPDE